SRRTRRPRTELLRNARSRRVPARDVLELDRDREDKADVRARERVLVLRAVRDTRPDLPPPHAIVGLSSSRRLLHDPLDLAGSRPLEAEVLDRGGGRTRALSRREIDELADLAGVHDERVPALAGVVALGPAEHVTVEIEDVLAAGVVEQRGVDRDCHVVEPGP